MVASHDAQHLNGRHHRHYLVDEYRVLRLHEPVRGPERCGHEPGKADSKVQCGKESQFTREVVVVVVHETEVDFNLGWGRLLGLILIAHAHQEDVVAVESFLGDLCAEVKLFAGRLVRTEVITCTAFFLK